MMPAADFASLRQRQRQRLMIMYHAGTQVLPRLFSPARYQWRLFASDIPRVTALYFISQEATALSGVVSFILPFQPR